MEELVGNGEGQSAVHVHSNFYGVRLVGETVHIKGKCLAATVHGELAAHVLLSLAASFSALEADFGSAQRRRDGVFEVVGEEANDPLAALRAYGNLVRGEVHGMVRASAQKQECKGTEKSKNALHAVQT